MKKLFDILEFALVGVGIGSIITTICISIMAGPLCRTKDFAVWIIVSAIIGIVTKLMYSDKINLLISTIIHLFVSFVSVLSASYICGYGNTLMELVKNILPVFLIIYFVIYAIIFVATKLNEKAVNKALNGKK